MCALALSNQLIDWLVTEGVHTLRTANQPLLSLNSCYACSQHVEVGT
jgi:hypothetical protein